METTTQVLRPWFLTMVLTVPLGLAVTSIFAFELAQIQHMFWTKPEQVRQDHPLVEVKNKIVRYRGGKEQPLPKRFAIFKAWSWVVIWVSFNLPMSLNRQGFTLWQCVIAGLALQAVLLFPIIAIFRRVQPRWLNAHLSDQKTNDPAQSTA